MNIGLGLKNCFKIIVMQKKFKEFFIGIFNKFSNTSQVLRIYEPKN